MQALLGLAGLLLALIALFQWQQWRRWDATRWPLSGGHAVLWVDTWYVRGRGRLCRYSWRDDPRKLVVIDYASGRDMLNDLGFLRLRFVQGAPWCHGCLYARTDTPALWGLWLFRWVRARLQEWIWTRCPVVPWLYARGYRWSEAEPWTWRTFWAGLRAGRLARGLERL